MQKLKLDMSPDIINYWIISNSYYSMQSLDKFINYFFPENIQVSVCDKQECNAKIYGIQEIDQTIMNDSQINIMLCIENC